jgi:hypothetical protein
MLFSSGFLGGGQLRLLFPKSVCQNDLLAQGCEFRVSENGQQVVFILPADKQKEQDFWAEFVNKVKESQKNGD